MTDDEFGRNSGNAKVQDGHNLLQKMIIEGVAPNVITYTAFLDLIAKAGGSLSEAEDVLKRMEAENLKPNNQTFATLLSVCAACADSGSCTHEVNMT